MTNLADLLPAGGGQNNTDFVADGNISAGAPVILTAAGKAAAVAKTPVSAALNDLETIASGTQYTQDWCYDTVNDKIVVIFSNSAYSSYPYYVIGTVTSQAVSWTTPTAIFSRAVNYISCCYNATEDRIVMCCEDSSLPKAIVGTSNGSSITWGSSVTIMNPSGSTPTWAYQNVVEWSGTSKVVWCGTEFNTNYQGYAAVATLSGSAGSATSTWDTNETTFTTAGISNAPKHVDMCYDYGTGDQVIILYAKGSTNVEVIAGAISGTTLTFGSPVVAKSSAPSSYTNAIDYDTGNSKALIVYGTSPTSGNAGTTNSRVISTSGSTITLEGTETAFIGTVSGGTTQYAYSFYKALTYAANSSNFVFIYESPSPDLDGYVTTVSISGTTITWSNDQTEIVAGEIPDGVNRVAYDPDTYQAVLLYRDGSASNYLKSQVYTIPYDATNLTSTNLLGLAPSAISNTATGTINTWGSRCENNDFFGTVSATYGSPTAASAYQSEAKVLAYDSANNRFVMAYKDGSNSDYGTAVVGELSGTSITWGTPVVFESATTGSAGMDIAFDSNVNRIVIAYQDQENSSYGTAIVGSVSGTGSGSTIAFGSPTIFESASTQYLSMTFDSNDNRIVIVYADAGNSFYATYVIGTVTTGPDAISFNTPALLNGSSGTYEIDASFDATENKVLVAYTDTSYDLYVLNLAISSGSGTPGTASSFGIGSPQQRYPRCVYDSVNGKSGVAYAEGTNLPIYFSVISMSGSNVTIETRVLAGDTSDSNYFMHNIAFDASSGQLAICTRDASASKGIAYYGSISGTTSSWTTSGSLFADETILTYGVDVAYDTSANKLAFVYSPSSGSDSAAVVGTLATTTLTIGSDYYVQEDGTLSTTSTSPAQLIGKAIKTNQINIKDYTG